MYVHPSSVLRVVSEADGEQSNKYTASPSTQRGFVIDPAGSSAMGNQKARVVERIYRQARFFTSP